MLDKIATYGFIISTVVVGILLYLLDSRQRHLKDVIYDYQKKTIDDKLKKAKEKLDNDKANYKTNKDRYDKLRFRFATFLDGTDHTRSTDPRRDD